VNRLILADDSLRAEKLWRFLVGHHWVVADSTVPNNSKFSRVPVPVGFDWSIPEYSGLHSWPGPRGLETEFTGIEPEECTIAEQYAVVVPGRYRLIYGYRTSDIPTATGIRWQILDPVSKNLIAESPDLSSSEIRQTEQDFQVPPGMSVALLRLSYKRPLGMIRISGALRMESVQIQATHN
jgi:hypothetical protein